MIETLLIYHSKANCPNLFDSVPLFIVRYKLRAWKVRTFHAQKRWCKKIWSFDLFVRRLWNSPQTSKRCNPAFVRSPSISDSHRVQTFQKTYQRPQSSWAIRQWCKKVRNTGSVKRQKESEGRSVILGYNCSIISGSLSIIQALCERDNCWWTTCWTIVRYRSETVRSFRFPVSSQSQCSKPCCTTVVWPMMMEVLM